MDRGYEKEPFETLSIKASVVKKFRQYAKAISKSQSMTLLLMVRFFESSGISPEESLGPHIQTLESLIKKRINGLTAIIRDVEKTQTKPSHAMLQLLFQENPQNKKELLIEKKAPELSSDTTHQMELLKYRKRAINAQDELKRKSRDLDYLIENVVVTRNNFGQAYLRLNLSRSEFEKLKFQSKIST